MEGFYDGSPTTAYSGVFGGHRAGKRKKGTSVLKRKPREAVRIIKFDVHDADGRIVALNVSGITYRSESALETDPWLTSDPSS